MKLSSSKRWGRSLKEKKKKRYGAFTNILGFCSNNSNFNNSRAPNRDILAIIDRAKKTLIYEVIQKWLISRIQSKGLEAGNGGWRSQIRYKNTPVRL